VADFQNSSTDIHVRKFALSDHKYRNTP